MKLVWPKQLRRQIIWLGLLSFCITFAIYAGYSFLFYQQESLIAIVLILGLAVFNIIVLPMALRRPLKALERIHEFSQKLATNRGVQIIVDHSCQEIAELMQDFNHISLLLKEQEDDVALRSKRLNAVMENAADGIITLNPQGKIESLNRAAKKIFKYPENEVVGTPIHTLIHCEGPNPLTTFIKETLQKDSVDSDSASTRGEVTGIAKDASKIPVEYTISKIPLRGGFRFICIIRDISERKEFERALEKAKVDLEVKILNRTIELKKVNDQLLEDIAHRELIERKLKQAYADLAHNAQEIRLQATALETAANSIMITDTTGNIQWVNPAFIQETGYSLQEVKGQNPRILKSGMQGHAFYHTLWHTILNGKPWRGELVNRRKNGSHYFCDLTITPVIDEKRQITSFVGIGQNITDRKQAEQELVRQKAILEKVNLELDSFVYTASHDLRAPLRGISSFASFLEEDYLDRLDETGKGYLTEIRKGTNLMSDLIDDLLTLSRISRIHNPYEDVDINDLIKKVNERLHYEIEETDTELIIASNMPTIRCDRIKMAEVFANLLSNAIKFSSKNPQKKPYVEMGYSETTEEHQFYIKDNGIGIAPEFHKKVFGIFKRLHTYAEFEGTGAGLSIVERIIKDHQGKIWIESQLAKGATFYFTIPRNLKERERETVSKIDEILIREGFITQTDLKATLEKQALYESTPQMPKDGDE
jgi:PAS domain S-box-containing protein